MKVETNHYGIVLQGYNFDVEANGPAVVTIKYVSMGIGDDVMGRMDDLNRDISLMNNIRNSADPAVKDMFEKLLTTMALTSGRVMDAKGARTK